MAATHDGSIASKVEGWIVTQIAALGPWDPADPNQEHGKVEAYRGSSVPGTQPFLDQLFAERSPYAAVLFVGDVPVPLEEGALAYDPTYAVYVAVTHDRGVGEARTGETIGGVTAKVIHGSNGMRDLLRNALHDQAPNLSANGFFAERSEFLGVSVVFASAKKYLLEAKVMVRETPEAA